jgi:hypothetical protein
MAVRITAFAHPYQTAQFCLAFFPSVLKAVRVHRRQPANGNVLLERAKAIYYLYQHQHGLFRSP